MHLETSQMKRREITEEEFNEMLTIQEAARMLSISERMVYYYINNNTLPHYKLPDNRKKYVKREEVMGLFQKAA